MDPEYEAQPPWPIMDYLEFSSPIRVFEATPDGRLHVVLESGKEWYLELPR